MPTPVTDLEGKLEVNAAGVLPDERLHWNVLAGGIPFADDFEQAKQQGMRPPRGVFAEIPGATPKYATNDGKTDGDFRESLARLFIQVPNYKKFVEEFKNQPEVQQVAKVLGGTVNSQGNSSGGNGYIDFLLQNVQHNLSEKTQVVELLTDDHVVYCFGQAAPMFSYSGTLLNTKQDEQAMNMLRLYREIGRGSKLAQRNTLLSIRYDGVIVSGVMMNLSMGLNAEMEMAVPFNFSLLVKQYIQLPTPYAGVVQLSKPFSVAKDGYRPFDQGLSGLNTASVKVVMAPPLEAIPVPAASKETEPTGTQPNFTAAQGMAGKATAKSTQQLADEAAAREAAKYRDHGPKL